MCSKNTWRIIHRTTTELTIFAFSIHYLELCSKCLSASKNGVIEACCLYTSILGKYLLADRHRALHLESRESSFILGENANWACFSLMLCFLNYSIIVKFKYCNRFDDIEEYIHHLIFNFEPKLNLASHRYSDHHTGEKRRTNLHFFHFSS